MKYLKHSAFMMLFALLGIVQASASPDGQKAVTSVTWRPLYGDVNQNGIVDRYDAMAIAHYVVTEPVRYSVESPKCPPYSAFDVNRNGVININDAIAIMRYLNGRTDIFTPKEIENVAEILDTDDRFTIFSETLKRTGLDKTLQQWKKDAYYSYAQTFPYDTDRNRLYCPEECFIKWTIFAETDDVFAAAGIHNFNDLKTKCAEWYGNPTWYDYVKEKGISISTGDDYENEWNVVHMFVAYHILNAGMPIEKLTYEKSIGGTNWNVCFGYDPQEYYETLLPNTLMKIWQLNSTAIPDSAQHTLLINRYRQNNTLTDEIGTFGSDATHPIIFKGVEIDRSANADGGTKSLQTYNGYVHTLKSILLYDQNAVSAQNERMRMDVVNFLPELINNGMRFASVSYISALNGGGNGDRIALDNTYFDNIVCYDPQTILRYNVMGAWRANNSDQLQGWESYDFAIKLPHVPTGTYELRIIYPPMNRGGMRQFYIGNTSEESEMIPLGEPIDMRINPTNEGNIMGCEEILTEAEYKNTDYGVASDKVMKERGYMRAPASFSRGTRNTITDKLTYDPSDIYSAARHITGSTSCRSEWGYGTMMLRYIVCTQRFEQGKDYWLRMKGYIPEEEYKYLGLGWNFDFIEFCPVGVSQNQTMMEDWY